MFSLRHTASILALSSLVLCGACGNKDSANDLMSPKSSKMSATPTSGKIMRKMLEVEDRKVPDSEAEQALKGLGLSGDSAQWTSKKGQAGDYQYENLTFKTDKNKTVNVAKLKLDGVHMEGETPSFDRMSMTDMKVSDDKGTGMIDSLTLSRPNPEMAAKILDMLANMDSLDDLDLNFKGEIGFGAILLEGMNVTGDDGNMVVDTFGWGTDETTGKGAFLAKNVSVSGNEKHSGKPFKLSLGSVTASDIDEEVMSKMGGKNARSMNMMESGFGNLQLQNLVLNSGSTEFNLTGFQTETKTKGKVTTERQVMSPLYINFGDLSQKGAMSDQLKVLSKIGVDSLEISGQATKITDLASDTLTVTDSFFSVKDIMDIRYDLEARGNGTRDDKSDLSSFEDMAINRMNFQLTDHSFVEKGMAIASEVMGMSPKMMQMNARIGLMGLPMLGETEQDKEVLSQFANAAADFMSKGGTINVKVNPTTPVMVGDLERLASGGVKGLDRFGLTITHQAR